MFATGYALLGRLGGWPRRLAALGCLLLAAASAIDSPDPHPAGAAADRGAAGNPLAHRLGPAQVAAPVAVTGPTAGFLRAGDRVDLYASGDALAADPACTSTAAVASRVPVLSVPPAAEAAPQPAAGRLVVAVDRPTAARLASLQRCDLLAVLDPDP